MEKIQGTRYPMCSSENKTFNNEQKFDGEFSIQNENLVFKGEAIYWINGNNVDLEIPLIDIEKVEPVNLNVVMPIGVCVYMKNGSQHMFGCENNRKLCKFILEAKNILDGNNQPIKNIKTESKKSKDRKPLNKKAIIITLTIVAIIAIIFISYLIVNDNKQKQMLIQEISQINSNEQIDMNIKTNGNYAKLEKTIKEYRTKIRKLEEQYHNNSAKKLFSELTPTYLAKNKENLAEKLNSLSQNEKIANESVQNIINMLNINYINNEISKYNLSEKYNKIYLDLILKDKDITKLVQNWKLELKDNTQRMTSLRELMQILVNNLDDWSVKNGVIKFKNPDSLYRYNILYDKLYK